jgi:hypothetical protein
MMGWDAVRLFDDDQWFPVAAWDTRGYDDEFRGDPMFTVETLMQIVDAYAGECDAHPLLDVYRVGSLFRLLGWVWTELPA